MTSLEERVFKMTVRNLIVTMVKNYDPIFDDLVDELYRKVKDYEYVPKKEVE